MRRVLIYTSLLARLSAAVNVTFTNCLSSSVVSPRFEPYYVYADFDTKTETISYQIYGDMVGQVNDTNADNTLASAVTDTISVAGYQQSKTDRRLCSVAYDGYNFSNPANVCPFGPGRVVLDFSVPLNSSFIFASLTSQVRINGPTSTNYSVGCLEITLTPPFSEKIKAILSYVPLAILLMVGLKVVLVALINPWSGTVDPYRAFSNFGMDVNALRLSTPGFSDCLMYIQFIAYSSMLSLDYPGFYQVATSRIAWAILLFESSPISKPLNYTPSQSTSIASYINFVGPARQDAWKSFMVWWVILLACVAGLVGVIISLWWLLTPSSTDLTRKNLPFLGGCMLRIYYWLLLPLALFTSYQLVTAQQSVAAETAIAALVLMLLITLCPLTLIYFLVRYKPRQDLYDDLSLLSLFGPLYNTYLEHATLLFVPNIILAIFRGLTIGFLQSHGIAQIVLLIIFEGTTLAFFIIKRPWPSSTNTTILNIILTGVRSLILILMILFIPQIGLSSGKREWIGYIILIFHAIVLVFGFLGNALLSLLEMTIRLLVIVPQDEGARAVFGARQLKSRRKKNANLGGQEATTTTAASATSMSNLLDAKEESPFFRAPRNPSRLSSRAGAESSLGDFRSISGSDGFVSPMGDTSYNRNSYISKMPVVRSTSFASEELLNSSIGRPGTITPGELDSSYDLYDLSLAATADAARGGVDYAVREADVYHPQSSGELLGPSKKLGTGPADPNGIKFRKLSWAPWKKEKNEERGKFVVIRSAPAPAKSAHVPMQELSPDAEVTSNPLSPRYETLKEETEEEDDQPQEAPVRRTQHRRTQSPILPQLKTTGPLLSPFENPIASPEDENHAFLTSPLRSNFPHQPRTRSVSQTSDTSVVSVLGPPIRPTTGERVASHNSGHTEHSVRSSLVRDSYVRRSTETPGVAAELIDLSHENDLD